MSRYDREDVEFLNLPDPDPTSVNYYINGGVAINRETYLQLDNPQSVCAKEVQNKETHIITYFVLTSNRNQMFDPKEHDSRYRTRNSWKFRRVNRSTFDLYVKFLTQHYKSFLLQAERGL